MSVYIKGLEMPQEKITLTIFPDGRVYENHGERLWGHGKDCIPWKAVPVHDHGRLGDLDELKKKAEWANTDDDTDVRVVRLDSIEEAATIIPANEEVYDKYTDTAGNLHWTEAQTGNHIILADHADKEDGK